MQSLTQFLSQETTCTMQTLKTFRKILLYAQIAEVNLCEA